MEDYVMGDHRADIKIEFTMHGQTDRTEMRISWCAAYDGVDEVTAWLSEKAEAAQRRYDSELRDREAAAEVVRTEKAERAEYARLRAKYG